MNDILERAIAAAETYWRDVLRLPGVPNIEARNLTNYTVVDSYLKLLSLREVEVYYYEQ